MGCNTGELIYRFALTSQSLHVTDSQQISSRPESVRPAQDVVRVRTRASTANSDKAQLAVDRRVDGVAPTTKAAAAAA